MLYELTLAAPLPSERALSLTQSWLAVVDGDQVRVVEAESGRNLVVLPYAGARECQLVDGLLVVASPDRVTAYAAPGWQKLWAYEDPGALVQVSASQNGKLVVVVAGRTVLSLDGNGRKISALNLQRDPGDWELDAGTDGRHWLLNWDALDEDQFLVWEPRTQHWALDGYGRAALHGGRVASWHKQRLSIFDLDTEKELGPVDCDEGPVSFSPGGARVLTGHQVWSGRDLTREGRSPAQGRCAFAGEERVVSWDAAGRVTLWEAASGQKLADTFQVVKDPAAVAADRARLAVAGGRTLQVWSYGASSASN